MKAKLTGLSTKLTLQTNQTYANNFSFSNHQIWAGKPRSRTESAICYDNTSYNKKTVATPAPKSNVNTLDLLTTITKLPSVINKSLVHSGFFSS